MQLVTELTQSRKYVPSLSVNRISTLAKHASINPKIVASLLEKLSADNKFRRLFKKDPFAALLEAGYEGVPLENSSLACMSVVRIASKREIQAAREQILSYLTSQGAYWVPHCFEAGKITSTLKLINRTKHHY